MDSIAHNKLIEDIRNLINNSGIDYSDNTPEATQIALIENMTDNSILEVLKEEWDNIQKYNAIEGCEILPFIYGNMYYPEPVWEN